MGLFEYKKVWHSDLKRASPLVVRFRTAPMSSQYLKDKSMIYFETDPSVDDLEGKYYVIETEEIEKQLQHVQKDVWVEIVATGGGNDEDAPEAKIEIRGLDGSEMNGLPSVPSKPAAKANKMPESKDFCGASVVETYYEALRSAPLLIQMFETEFGREPLPDEIILGQHMFAHWAIKGFDRPLYPGQLERDTQSYRDAAEDRALPATQDQLAGIQSLAKLKAKVKPDIVEQVNKRIADGVTEDEADEILRELAEIEA